MDQCKNVNDKPRTSIGKQNKGTKKALLHWGFAIGCKFSWRNYIRKTKGCTKRCTEISEISWNWKFFKKISSMSFLVDGFLSPLTYKNANLGSKNLLENISWNYNADSKLVKMAMC